MNKIGRIIVTILTLASIFSVESYAQGQKVPSNRRGIELIEYQRCKDGDGGDRGLISWSGWISEKNEVPIGLKIYSTIGQLREFRPENRRLVICRIAEVGETPRFKTLTLSMGFANSNSNEEKSDIRVTVYKDGNRVDSIIVGHGEPVNFQADIAQGRDIAIEFSCIETGNKSWCGKNFYFFDASVR